MTVRRRAHPVRKTLGIRRTLHLYLNGRRGGKGCRTSAICEGLDELHRQGYRRECENLNIQEDRLCPGVLDIEFDHPCEGGAILAFDLPESGEAGEHREPFHLGGLVLLQFERCAGAGTDETHFASENIDELRQLVEAEGANDATERDDAWVCGIELPHGGVALLELAEIALVGIGFRPDPHGPELVAMEATSAVADTFLDEKQRPGRDQLDDRGADEPDREGYGQRKDQQAEVENAFPAWNLFQDKWLEGLACAGLRLLPARIARRRE